MGRIKHRFKSNLMMGWIVFLSLLMMPQLAAADSSAALPHGMIVGDDQGIGVKSDGDYFVHIEDVQPGKRWTKKITIHNLEDDVPYQLTMHVSKPTLIEGSLDLSEAIQMTLSYEGKKVYQGPLSGVSSSVNLQNEASPLHLGIFKGGDTRMLEAVFELDGKKYTNKDFLKKNIVENVWHFKAVKTVLPNTNRQQDEPPVKKIFRLPQTGEEWRNTLIYSCIGLFFLLVVLLIIKHRLNGRKPK